jgi:ATP-dependent Lhr-like helicase
MRRASGAAGNDRGTGPVPAAAIDQWFATRGWQPFEFQRRAWAAIVGGEDGLLHATTGAGKTYALWFGALQLATARPARADLPSPLTVLWISPMRALSADTARALAAPLPELGADWTIGVRTGDTGSAERAAQSLRLPTALVTTPESLSLMLSRPDARSTLATVRLVVVDEWHELLGSKRGVQVQLALARLRRWCRGLRCWGLSATLGNLDEALAALLPAAGGSGAVVEGRIDKAIAVDTLLPENVTRFPWAGHLGMKMLPAVVAELEQTASALVFTNTRSQAELWYQALLDARPDWAGVIALHHGSLDRATRDWVERAMKEGRLRAVVCTSSLDLGVDFLPVERVLQIGSAKGVARLLQRAGRSGHAPGRASRVTLVPTHSLELLEAAAARRAVVARRIEARRSPARPLDVLVQHLVTVALGGGFTPDDLLAEVRSAHAYRALTAAQWQWCLDFVRRGGPSLTAYPEYRRVEPDEHGVWRVPDGRLARRHRMSIGTIVSDASMTVRYWGKGAAATVLGTVEESFIARLSRGDCFLFGGRLLELVRVHEMTAYVRRAAAGRAAVPRWNGGKMPLSSELADAMRLELDDAEAGRFDSPEMQRLQPLLGLQARWSALPVTGRLLAETLRSREGWHLFLYPFAGRQVHLGIASLLAWRVGRASAATFSMAVNDYGLELLSPQPVNWEALLQGERASEAASGLFGTENLLGDLVASLNAAELAQRRFREIARVSGLVFQGFPGAGKSTRQLQASSGLFYQVFRQHDPENLLLDQAEEEVLRQELEVDRLEAALARLRADRLVVRPLARPSPFAFPLLIERLREKLSTEKLRDRIERMLRDLERAADAPPPLPRRRSREAATTAAAGAAK